MPRPRKKFDPKTKIPNKRIVYTPVNHKPAIRYIWEWCDKTNQYKKRLEGNKYNAYKYICIGDKKKQVEASFKSLAEAEEWRKSTNESPSLTVRYTLLETLEKYLEHSSKRLRKTSIETYLNKTRHFDFLLQMYIDQITSHTLDQWLEKIKQPSYLRTQHKTRTSYRHELRVLGQIFNYYAEYIAIEDYQSPIRKRHLEDSIVDVQRFKEAKERNKNKYISRDEIIHFLKTFEEFARSNDNPIKQCMFLLALVQVSTGSRIGEAASLFWSDIDFENNCIHVSKTVHWLRTKGKKPEIYNLTKTCESRIIPMIPITSKHLKEWKLLNSLNSDLVFNKDGEILKYRSIQYHYDLIFAKAGLKFSSSHILRHSFASLFLESTSDLSSLRGLMGHATTQMSDHYAVPSSKLKQKTMSKFGSSLLF